MQRFSVSTIMDASLGTSLRCHFLHETIVVCCVTRRRLCEHTESEQGSLTGLVSLEEGAQGAEGLPLVPHLVY